MSADKRKAFQAILSKLQKLLAHLSNANERERATALDKVNQLLAGAGLDWNDLVNLMAADDSDKESSLLDMFAKLLLDDTTLLIRIAHGRATFFHSGSAAFADVLVDGHRRTFSLSASDFSEWLLLQFFGEKKKAPSSAAMRMAIRTLAAHAKFASESRAVYLRAGYVDGKIYLDVGDSSWSVIEIDGAGWRLVEDAPVRFRRTEGMTALPIPERGGSIELLRPLANLGDDGFILFVSWLLDALCPAPRPHPLLFLTGEEGSAKTSLARIARNLVDPSATPARNLPTTVRDLFVSAHGSHALVYDNVSSISPAISDALCQIASGSGFGTRRLFTDVSQILIGGSRPVILNGLMNAIDRSDLADRATVILMSPIPPHQRFSEAEIWRLFEAHRCQIFGALLDCVARGLRQLPSTRLEQLPRMADYCVWSIASSPFEPGAFLKAFKDAAAEAVEVVAESDPVTVAVAALMTKVDSWSGTAAVLLGELNSRQDCVEAAPTTWRSWPSEPSSFSRRLRKAASVLRKLGITVTVGRAADRSRTRKITLSKVEASNRPNRPNRPDRPDRPNRPEGTVSKSKTSDTSDTSDSPANIGGTTAVAPVIGRTQ